MPTGLMASFEQTSPMLTVIVNFGMFLVWVIYLQIFLVSYLRQRRASILISRGAPDIDARCLVGNMSAEPVYVQSIVARIATTTENVFVAVTDRQPEDDPSGLSINQLSRQGPLLPGHYMEVDSFRRMFLRLNAERGVESTHGGPANQDAEMILEVLVFAYHGSDDLMVAARRKFRIQERGDRWHLSPLALNATQVRSRPSRRRLMRRWKPALLE